MTKNKKIGTALIILPPTLFIVSNIGYAIVSFVLNQQLANGNPNTTSFAILRTILGLCGMLGIVGFFISIPIGVYFLAKK